MLRRRRRTDPVGRVRAYLDTHPGWWSADDLSTATGLGPAVARWAADQLVEQGRADVWSTGADRLWASARDGPR